MKQFIYLAAAIPPSLLDAINRERVHHGIHSVASSTPLKELLAKMLDSADHPIDQNLYKYGTLNELFGNTACHAFPGNQDCTTLPADMFFPRSGMELFSVAASSNVTDMLAFIKKDFQDIVLNQGQFATRTFKSGAEVVDKGQHFIMLSPY
ncbi:hypothetical protein DSO57_1037823 [Entomophthora muscae]|uniref:Uncharacterized protein n=2 Tax=Entomophthora muscae TaxID=34485 RepID=A0ACC2T9J5_9FUNG|nr:hypothetical protein DSO57_1033351 [Entomophthora muscae]KAJ9071349.1 hypothetical protein DSO57_1037823 [Entomophthora muscae]